MSGKRLFDMKLYPFNSVTWEMLRPTQKPKKIAIAVNAVNYGR